MPYPLHHHTTIISCFITIQNGFNLLVPAYVGAIYCYRPNSVVCRSVTLVSPAKMAEPIEMPLGLRSWVSPGNRVLDGVQMPHGKGQF